MINNFRGKYFFLSNFSDSKIILNDITFNNAEAAFQSFKNLTKQKQFVELNPSIAKRKGRHIKLRHDWDNIKDDVMYQVVKAKFEQNEELKKKLLDTRDEYLEESTTWKDAYWGTYNGRGKNKLGKILMRVRSELKEQ